MGFVEITRKDLLLLLRDRRALVVLLLLPMAFICILGLSTGRLLGWRNGNQFLRLGVVDESRTRHSKLIIERMQAIDGVQIVQLSSLEEAEQRLSDRNLTAAVVIGSNFEAHVEQLAPHEIFDAEQARMKISLDDVDISILSRPAAAMVQSVVDQLVLFCTLQAVLPDAARRATVQKQVFDLMRGAPSIDTAPRTDDSSRDQVQESPEEPDAVLATDDDSSGQGNPVYQTLVPAYTVMFAFFLVPIMGRSFIAERELGTLKRLRMAPISTADLVLGKTIPFLIISLAQSTALFLFGRLLFGMSWGSQPWLLLPIIFCTSLAATGMGLLVATMVRTDSQVSAYANFLVITMAGISGCFMPRDWLPEMMRTVSLSVPHAWSLVAYHEALTTPAPRLAVIAQACGILSMMATLLASLGCWQMHRSHD